MDPLPRILQSLYEITVRQIDRDHKLTEPVINRMVRAAINALRSGAVRCAQDPSYLTKRIVKSIKAQLSKGDIDAVLLDSLIVSAIADVNQAISKMNEGLEGSRFLFGAGAGADGLASKRADPLLSLVSKYPWREQIICGFDPSVFDLRALVHVVGDRVAGGSGYEGMINSHVYNLLISLLKSYQMEFSSISPYRSSQVERALSIVERSVVGDNMPLLEKACLYATKIRSLEVGDTVLIFVGFVNHSVIVEVVYKGFQDYQPIYDLHIYDASGEGRSHSEEVSVSGLDTRMTRINFLGIPENLLLIGDSGTAWLELLLGVKSDSKGTVIDDLDPLISVAFSHLGVSSTTDLGGYFYRIQQSGTCNWRSLIAWLHFQFQDIEDYKAVVTWMGTQTLARCAVSSLGKSDLRPEEFRLLTMCARELQLQTALRLEKHRFCTEFEQAAAVSYQIREECAEKGAHVSEVTHPLKMITIDQMDSRVFKSICEGPVLANPIYIPSPALSAASRMKWSGTLFLSLENILSEKLTCDQNSFLESLAHFVIQLPRATEISKGAIKGIETDVRVLPLLVELQKSLSKSGNPVHRLASFKLLAITHHIACEISGKKDGGLLRKQKMQNIVSKWLKDPYIIITNIELLKEIDDLIMYFSPYVSDKETDMLIPLEVGYNPSYLASDHNQAIVRWAYGLYHGLTSEDKEKFGYVGSVNKVVYEFLQKSFESFRIDDPGYPGLILIQSICQGLEGVFIRSTEDRTSYSYNVTGLIDVLYLFFELKDVVPIRERFDYFDLQLGGREFFDFVDSNKSFAREDIPTEEEAVLSGSVSKFLDGELQTCLLCSQTEKSLAPAYLIHHFGQNLEKLADPKLRSLFTLVLLKMVILPNGTTQIPFERALTKKSFKDQFEDFIDRGMIHFSRDTLNGKPNHTVLIALLRIAVLAGSDAGLSYIKDQDVIDGTESERKMYQMLRLFYFCKLRILSTEDAIEIVKIWLKYKSIEDSLIEYEGVLWFQQISEGLYYQRVEAIMDLLSQGSIYSIGKEAFANLGVELPEDEEFENVGAASTCFALGPYRMDLLRGLLCTETGIIGCGLLPKFVKDSSFKKRFPKAYAFRIEGSDLFFQVDKTLFKTLFDMKLDNWEKSLEISQEGDWLSFVDPLELEKIMPLTLACRYLYFVDKTRNLIRGFSREDFSECVVVTSENIYDKNDKSLVLNVDTSDLIFNSTSFFQVSEFHKRDQDQEIIIKMPYFHIWGSGELNMLVDAKLDKLRHLVYDGYSLDKGISENSRFGSISQYIAFSHEDGRKIYYIPVVEWIHQPGVSGLTTEVVPKFPKMDLFSSLDGKIQLMEYRDEGLGKLEPVSLEGAVYLALIWLIQKEFDRFLDVLKKIDKEALNSIAVKDLIRAAVRFLERYPETSFENLAAVTHLIAFAWPFLIEDSKSWMLNIYIKYIRNFMRIPLEFRLPSSLEYQVAVALNVGWRIAELRDTRPVDSKTLKRSILVIKPEEITDTDCIDIYIKPLLKQEEVSDRAFPALQSELLTAEETLLTSSRLKLCEYALRANCREDLDHLNFYIDTQLKMTYLISREGQFARRGRIPFLLMLKAIHQKKLSELLGLPENEDFERSYQRFMAHFPYLQGNIIKFKDPFSAESIDYNKQIKNDLASLCQVFKDQLRLNIKTLDPLIIVEKRTPIPSTRLHVFTKYKPPSFNLPRPKESWPHSAFSKEEIKLLIQKKESEICEILNFVAGSDPLAKFLKKGLDLEKVYTIADAIYIFFRGQKELFLDANPSLSERRIIDLMDDISKYLILKTEQQHLSRIAEGRAQDLDRSYNPEKEPYLLVFEYGMDIRLDIVQVRLIRRMLQGDEKGYQTVAIQARTGIGKTTVFDTILCALAPNKISKTGEIGFGLVVTPRPQIGMVKKSLKVFLENTFNKKLFVFEFERDKISRLGLKKLQSEFDEFKDAIDLGYPIIASPESLQLLELEFLSRLHRLNQESSLEEIRIVELLREICLIISSRGHAIIDEAHEVIDTHKEVNLASGVCLSLSHERTFIIRNIYKIVLSRDSIIGLVSNSQSDMNPILFRNHIMREIGGDLITFFNEYSFNDEEFIQFLCSDDKIPVRFLIAFDNLKIRNVKKAEAIAVAKHILSDLLPHVLSKSCGRDYGRASDVSSFKVIPFGGVGRPLESNEFGNPIEAACFHMQTAIQTETTPAQIKTFGLSMKEKAIKTAEVSRCCVLDTPEAIRFLEITGISLSLINDEASLKQAIDKLKSERARNFFINILEMEELMIQEVVLYHSSRLVSGPHDLLAMVASKRLYSATPWNIETVLSDVRNSYIPDAVGSRAVKDALLSRSTKDDPHIHIIERVDPSAVIEALFAKGKIITAILDPPGMLKDLSNFEAALQIRNCLRRNNQGKFKGILFFTTLPISKDEKILPRKEWGIVSEEREEKVEFARALPDFLAFLPIDGDQIIYLNGTNLISLKEKGLLPRDCFVYMDQNHTTGTDLVMADDACGALLTNDLLTEPVLNQAIGRFRKYHDCQDVEIVIAKGTLEKIGLTGIPTMQEVIDLSIAALDREKHAIMYQAFCGRVDQVARGYAIKILQSKKGDILASAELARKFTPILMSNMIDDPIQMFTGGQEESFTRDLLIERFLEREHQFIEIYPRGNREFFRIKLDEILTEVDSSVFLPPKQKGSQRVGQTVHQEVAMTVQVTMQKEIEIDLEKIDRLKGATTFKQIEMSDKRALIRLNRIRKGKKSEFVKTVSDFFIRPFEKDITSFESFAKVLSPNVLSTRNFALVTLEQLPLFHKDSKLITTVLLVQCPKVHQESDYKIVLLSAHESEFWQGYLERISCDGVWLIDKCGISFADKVDLSPPPLENPKVRLLLIEVNALAGNLNYLLEHASDAASWLRMKRDLKLKLLRYAVLSHKNPSQKKLLENHPLFTGLPAESSLESQKTLLDQSEVHRIQSLGPDEIAKILPEEVYLISREQVQYLKTEDQIRMLSPSLFSGISSLQADLIAPEQVQLLDQVDVIREISRLDLLKELNTDQLENILNWQVKLLLNEPDVIGRFGERAAKKLERESPEKLCYLRLRLAIQVLDDENCFFLSEDALKMLSEERLKNAANLLSRNQIASLDSPFWIQKLSIWKTTALPIDKFQYLSEEQLHFLKVEILSTGSQLLENMSEDQKYYMIRFFGDEPSFVQTLPIDLCLYLNNDQIKYLSGEQIKQIQKKHTKLIPYVFDVRALILRVDNGADWILEYMSDNQLLKFKSLKGLYALNELSAGRCDRVTNTELRQILKDLGKIS